MLLGVAQQGNAYLQNADHRKRSFDRVSDPADDCSSAAVVLESTSRFYL